ncbi:hypothetical protein GCM10007937_05220 [Mesorhizobium albiziae]|nr:hypothetical protein GCM10007937_05220 [Mesorhizobium albiziae]
MEVEVEVEEAKVADQSLIDRTYYLHALKEGDLGGLGGGTRCKQPGDLRLP